MITIESPNPVNVHHVFENMRDGNRREFAAVSWNDEPPDYIRDIAIDNPEHFVVVCREKPIAVLGGVEAQPKVWGVMMFATDDVRRIGFSLAKISRDAIIPQMFHLGANRLQCTSPGWFTDAHRWLEFLGFRKESEMPAYGKDGETFFVFSLTRDHYVQSR
jgi:hypothetical protein